LWAESGTTAAAGGYTGHFAYSNAIGWQTAIVALKPWARAVAFGQSVSTFQNTAVNITLTGSSPTNQPLTYTITGSPSHGTLVGTPPSVSYTPASNYVGSDSFTFKVHDANGDSNIATVSINVKAPNHPPVASDGNATVSSGSPGTVG